MSKFRDIFRGKRFVTARNEQEAEEKAPKKEVPDGLWTKCPGCRTLLYNKDLERNLNVCDKCEHHFPMSAEKRLAHLVDDLEAFTELDAGLSAADPLQFPQYGEKLERGKEKTGKNDAITTGIGTIGGKETVFAVMEFAFMGGSMGAVVGERITRAFEYATAHGLPVITVSASGGARMQEGILSLMQMQKTAAAVWNHSQKGLLYISVLTHPTTAGVFGSFASLGDVNLSEPGATVGFAGQRVIEETIRKAVPTNLQKAETVFENGFIDKIIPRTKLRDELLRLIVWHTETGPIEIVKKEEPSEAPAPSEEDDQAAAIPAGEADADTSANPVPSEDEGENGTAETARDNLGVESTSVTDVDAAHDVTAPDQSEVDAPISGRNNDTNS